MKLGLSEGEKYPHRFIRTRAESVELFGENYAHLAGKWLAAQSLWNRTEEEIAAFLKARNKT